MRVENVNEVRKRLKVVIKELRMNPTAFANIATTLKFYARLSDESVIDEMKKAGLS